MRRPDGRQDIDHRTLPGKGAAFAALLATGCARKESRGSRRHDSCRAFLVPADVLERAVGRHRGSIPGHELLALKRLLGGQRTGACLSLVRTSASSATGVHRDLPRIHRGAWHPKKPLAFLPERPAWVERLCLLALADGLISESSARPS